ncbi:MAG: hypothetical protein ACLRYF_04120 [Mediterraneibacter faecis]
MKNSFIEIPTCYSFSAPYLEILLSDNVLLDSIKLFEFERDSRLIGNPVEFNTMVVNEYIRVVPCSNYKNFYIKYKYMKQVGEEISDLELLLKEGKITKDKIKVTTNE